MAADCLHSWNRRFSVLRSDISFPGSFILGKKDPGSGWSRASQKVGGDKKTAGGRSEQVAILSHYENLSENVTHLSYVRASTASADVEDTEKDICSV